jgi:hypothetical protein
MGDGASHNPFSGMAGALFRALAILPLRLCCRSPFSARATLADRWNFAMRSMLDLSSHFFATASRISTPFSKVQQ